MRHIHLALGVAAVLAACTSTPPPSASPSTAETVSAEARAHGLVLTATADPATATSGEVIDVVAELANDGPDPIILSGSGDGLVYFSVTRIEDGLSSGPSAHHDDCATHELPAGARTSVPFAKSGGWSEDDPNAAFLSIYFADPQLTLPAGTWRIDVTTAGTIGEGCTGEPLGLALSLVVTVTD